mmetsp:Transcript_74455/g.218262  ORF Transcript_74455/g.218262 Transcript_74455/m.218262 type:complete len:222 (+) Transcript_74455:490-1155(+)
MPSSAPMPNSGGADVLSRTAGTLLRPLGTVPTSLLPKPMRSRREVSCSANSAVSAPRVTVLSSSVSSSSTSASCFTPRFNRKVPRTMTSSRRRGAKTCATTPGRETVSSAASAPDCRLSARGIAASSSLKPVAVSAAAAWSATSHSGVEAAQDSIRLEHPDLACPSLITDWWRCSQCHLARRSPRDSTATASPRAGGSDDLLGPGVSSPSRPNEEQEGPSS